MADVSNTSQQISLDEDEGIDDLSGVISTTSLRSSLFDHRVEHGRQYHAFKDGSYHRPNDENELDRLDLMNAMLTIVNNDRLHLAPIGPTPHRILDIGAGTGIWCFEMGEQYPSAEVLGVDISPSMPAYVPPNVRFEIDDVEDQWTYNRPFDYIHSRYMAGSIKDWPKFLRQCFENTQEKGFVELQDFDIDYYSQDGSLTKENALKRWLDMAYDAEAVTGRTLKPGPNLERWMTDAGFVNVQVVKTPLPVGPWPKNKKLKQIGLFNWTQLWEGLQGMSLRLFIDCLGWSEERLELLLMEVRQDLKNNKIHPIFDVYSVWGQKPVN